MGGAGGYTCMSEDAKYQVEEFRSHYESFDDHKREQIIREVQMDARAMALQTQGIIPLQSDLVWVIASLGEVEVESLRLKGTDER